MRLITPWQLFWWLTAMLTFVAVVLVHKGVVEWFVTHFPGVGTLATSAGMLFVFSVVFSYHGRLAAKELHHEGEVLHAFREHIDAVGIADGVRSSVEQLFRQLQCEQPGKTALSHVLQMILKLSAVRREAKNHRPLDKDMLTEQYENRLYSRIDSIEHYRRILFYLGLLGTVGGVIYALATTGQPTTAEEMRLYSLLALEGLGVAYTSTFFGMGGAIILLQLNKAYRNHADDVFSQFRQQLEVVLLVAEDGPYSE